MLKKDLRGSESMQEDGTRFSFHCKSPEQLAGERSQV